MDKKFITPVLNKILKHSSQQDTLAKLKDAIASKNPYTDSSVQSCIESLYNIYTDLTIFAQSVHKNPETGKTIYKITESLKPLLEESAGMGQVDDGDIEDSEEVDDKELKNTKKVIAAFATNALSSPVHPVLDKDRFKNLLNDMFMSSSMRAWRAYLLIHSNDKSTKTIPIQHKIAKAVRNISKPMDQASQSEYRHELNSKFPTSLADKEALQMFMQSTTPFALQAKEQYGIENLTEATVDSKVTHDVDAEGAKLIRKALYKEQPKPRVKEKPTVTAEPTDYVIYSTIHTMTNIMEKGDIVSTDVVETIFKQTGNSLGEEDFESSSDMLSSASEVMDTDTYEDDYQEKEHTTMLSDEEIHNEYVVVVCKKVLDELPSDVINSFNFKVIDPAGTGKILNVNLYRDIIRSEFNENLYTREGATLIQQLYRNWIPAELDSGSSSATTTTFIKSAKELEALKDSLPTEPKSLEALKDLASSNLAVATINKGAKAILNPYIVTGRIMDRVGERLRPYFAPNKASSAMSGPALIASAKSTFGIAFGAVSKGASVKKGAVLSSGQMDLNQAFDIYMSSVSTDLRNIDIMRKVSTSKDPGPSVTNYRVLYPAPTEEERQAQVYPPLYPTKEAYEAKVNQFETALRSSRDKLLSMTSISEVLDALTNDAADVFGAEEFRFFRFEKVKGASRTAPAIGTMFFPDQTDVGIAKLTNDFEATGILKRKTASEAFNLAVAIVANNKQNSPAAEAVETDQPQTSSINTDYTVVFNTVNLYCKLSLLKAVIRFSKVVKEIETGFSELLAKLDTDTKGLLYEDSESVEAGPRYDEEADELVNTISKHLSDMLLGKEDSKSFEEYVNKRQQLFVKRNKHKNIELPQGKLEDLTLDQLFGA